MESLCKTQKDEGIKTAENKNMYVLLMSCGGRRKSSGAYSEYTIIRAYNLAKKITGCILRVAKFIDVDENLQNNKGGCNTLTICNNCNNPIEYSDKVREVCVCDIKALKEIGLVKTDKINWL